MWFVPEGQSIAFPGDEGHGVGVESAFFHVWGLVIWALPTVKDRNGIRHSLVIAILLEDIYLLVIRRSS